MVVVLWCVCVGGGGGGIRAGINATRSVCQARTEVFATRQPTGCKGVQIAGTCLLRCFVAVLEPAAQTCRTLGFSEGNNARFYDEGNSRCALAPRLKTWPL